MGPGSSSRALTPVTKVRRGEKSPRGSPREQHRKVINDLKASLREAESELNGERRKCTGIMSEHLEAQSRLALFENSIMDIQSRCNETIRQYRMVARDEVSEIVNVLHRQEQELHRLQQEDEGATIRVDQLSQWLSLSQSVAAHIQQRGVQAQENFEAEIQALQLQRKYDN